jgi:hypothetical protein
MLSHSPDLAANIVKSSTAEKRCYRCQRAAFFNGCDCIASGQLLDRACRYRARRWRDQATELSDNPGKVAQLFTAVAHRDDKVNKNS